jgi:hypothetical protein
MGGFSCVAKLPKSFLVSCGEMEGTAASFVSSPLRSVLVCPGLPLGLAAGAALLF